MGDMESFGGMDSGGEAHDPASFERFKQRMKAASQQIQAQQKQEKKQKKSEDELIKILVRFIRSGASNEILQLVTRLLEQNTPAGFVLSLLMIAYSDIQKEMGVLLLPTPKSNEQNPLEGDFEEQSNLPAIRMGDATIPLKVQIAITNWIAEIGKRVAENPHKTIKTVMDQENKVNHTCIQLASFCLRDFMATKEVKTEFGKIKEFVKYFLTDLLHAQIKQLDERKDLKEGEGEV